VTAGRDLLSPVLPGPGKTPGAGICSPCRITCVALSHSPGRYGDGLVTPTRKRRFLVALEGTLRDMSLEDLFEIFEAGSRSGRLSVTCNLDHCVILISRGQLAEAVLFRGPHRQRIAEDTDAVIQICRWDDAAFAFEHATLLADRPRRITLSFPEIQDRALREIATSSARLSVADVIRPTAGEPGAVCAEAGIARADGLRIAQGLARRGLLQRVEQGGAPPVSHARPGVELKVGTLAPHRPPPSPSPARAVRVTTPSSLLLKAIIRRMQSL
jgi:hypothetical protein